MENPSATQRYYIKDLGEVIRVEDGNPAELSGVLDKNGATPLNLRDLAHLLMTDDSLLDYSKHGTFVNLVSDAIVAVPKFPRIIACNAMTSQMLRKEFKAYSENCHPSSLSLNDFYGKFLMPSIQERSNPHAQKDYLILDEDVLGQCEMANPGFYINTINFQTNPITQALFKDCSGSFAMFLENLGAKNFYICPPTTKNYFYNDVTQKSGENRRSFVSPLLLGFTNHPSSRGDKIQVFLSAHHGGSIFGKIAKP